MSTDENRPMLELIEQRKNARSSTPDEERKRCPECGSTGITPKPGGICDVPRQKGRYRCNYCKHNFDNPVVGEEVGDE